MIIVAAIGFLFSIYTYFQVRKLQFIDNLAGEQKWKKNIFPALIIIVLLAVGYLINMVVTVVIAIHLMIFWLIANIVALIIHKATHKKVNGYIVCLVAVCLTVAYLGYACYNDNNVVKTTYQITSNKDASNNKGESLTSLKIAQITDTHIGTTFDGEGFADELEKVKAQNPDVVFITGDFVDDDTSKEDMIEACKALGQLKTKYGVYFITGNHDPSYFYNREYNMGDLERELKNNGVEALIDEAKLVDGAFYVVGRMDRRFENERKSMKELTESLDESKYMIVLDHQPHDFKAQQKAGADLVLCGHTHGGQMFPLGYFGEWSGANEKTYGLEKRGSTYYEVSSGMSGWGMPFKTGAKSEFVIINVQFQ